uniref:Uncharacterized protein n=1 Tax=Fagus sylvatica TaxID=28930 RepID=A0A2N9HW37_FAGSY
MARTQSRSRASKLARLVNSEASMTRFRELYRVPPSIRLAYCNTSDFPVINRDEILLPIMAVVEGGVRFPLYPLLINFLQIVNATASQVSVNLFQIIMGVVTLNRILGVNLNTGEILRVYQYMCPGEESRTLCHLKAKNVNQKLVNGLPDTNKGYDKDYLRVSGDWFTESKCRSSFGYPDPSRIALYESQADIELVKRVLATNVYVDQRGEPRSAPLLLSYEPQIRSFLEGPTVPRSQEVRVEPSILCVAVPADTTVLSEDPELIPTGQVFEMAPPINPFELMGKATGGSSSEAAKGKATAVQEPPRPLLVVHEIDESDHGEDLASPRKKGKKDGSLGTCSPRSGPSSLSSRRYESMGQHELRATQGVLSMESRVVRMTDELQKKGADYKKLEDQHFKNVNLMKEAEERAKAEVENREKIEVELTKLKEKVRKLESECIASIEKAREEGKEEGKAEGKVLGHEAAMDEARTQFRMVYNSGFRQGWKSALKKTEQPESSELFLRSNTPIPYPKEGLKDSDDEAQEEEEEEEEDGEGEEEIRPDSIQEDSQPVPIEKATDAPGPTSSL